MIEPALLKRIVEAALLASNHPLSVPQLSALFAEEEMPSHEDLARAIAELGVDCIARGVELQEVASGFRYQVRQDIHPWVARLWTERQTRYSRAQLETLALIAYRQPITRGEIEQIRGVAVSSNIIKTLEEREWIRSVGHRDVPGKPELFGTTRTFLDYFNLKSLDELPPLAEIRDLNEFDPQLNLTPIGLGAEEDIVVEAIDETTILDISAESTDAAAEDATVVSSEVGAPHIASVVEMLDTPEFVEEPIDLGFSPLGEESDSEDPGIDTEVAHDATEDQEITETADESDSATHIAEPADSDTIHPQSPDTAASAESSPHHVDDTRPDESDESTPHAASNRDAATPEPSA